MDYIPFALVAMEFLQIFNILHTNHCWVHMDSALKNFLKDHWLLK